uniref:Ferritin-like domain-containing protein n=1 Tax=Arcella intermedia TaxID=1963864 RepID=A0A6B2LEC8_9EUKA
MVSPKEMPTAKQAGVSSSIYLTHSLAHIELNAVELAWDTLMMAAHEKLPEEFFKDFISIAADEARHFDLLCDHLKSQGSQYGAIPAHDNLWNIAIKTKDDILARVAMIQLVQEPRALDSHDRLRKKFIGAQDKKAVQLIDVICYEEIEHVRIGMKWYEYLCRRAHKEPIPTFHALATQLAVVIPPPFNVQSRQQAGMPPEWYLPIAKTHKAHPKSSH